MANNLFIAFDLVAPGQNYDAVKERIQELGQWHQFQISLFYVHTSHSPHTAHHHVSSVLDADDRLIVVDATSAVLSKFAQPDVDSIDFIWIPA